MKFCSRFGYLRFYVYFCRVLAKNAVMTDNTSIKTLDKVVVRFSGDSGDGMQLAGNIFTNVSAGVGNQVSTFPDYPAEIRAPQGSLSGVSGFQVSCLLYTSPSPRD